jgi:hypothetical protein
MTLKAPAAALIGDGLAPEGIRGSSQCDVVCTIVQQL